LIGEATAFEDPVIESDQQEVHAVGYDEDSDYYQREGETLRKVMDIVVDVAG
jgi:hypothetical protein